MAASKPFPLDSPVVSYRGIQGGYARTGNIDANLLFMDAGHWDDNGTPDVCWDDLRSLDDPLLQRRRAVGSELRPLGSKPVPLPNAHRLEGGQQVLDALARRATARVKEDKS